jgi:hypothetical protein
MSKLRAAEIHNSIPQHLRASPSPIAFRVSPRQLHKTFASSHAIPTRYCAGDWLLMSSYGPNLLAHVERTAAVSIAMGDTGGHTRLGDHSSLRAALNSGAFRWRPDSLGESRTIESARAEAASMGYQVPQVEGDHSTCDSAFTAATDIFLRTRANVWHMSAHFIIPDTVEGNTVSFADLLWVTPMQGTDGEVRLVAIVIDDELGDPGASQNNRHIDQEASRSGYEVIRVRQSWMKVDPQRAIYASMQVADIRVTRPRPLPCSRPTIRDYRCDYCGQPMARDAQGYGIVGHRGFLVHEGCHDRAINEGYFDGSGVGEDE